MLVARATVLGLASQGSTTGGAAQEALQKILEAPVVAGRVLCVLLKLPLGLLPGAPTHDSGCREGEPILPRPAPVAGLGILAVRLWPLIALRDGLLALVVVAGAGVYTSERNMRPTVLLRHTEPPNGAGIRSSVRRRAICHALRGSSTSQAYIMRTVAACSSLIVRPGGLSPSLGTWSYP